MTHKTLTYDALRITPADVYEQMGYHGTLPDEPTQAETMALIGEVSTWLRPQFCYLVQPELPASFTIGEIISRQLKGSEGYACFIATSGSEFEDFQRRLTKDGDMVRVFIADALGSVIAEKCADEMEKNLQESIGKLGWHHTNRFSPGYCGWHVSQQQLLFPIFKGETCGVALTDSSLMIPIKSVSGIIGLGKEVCKLDYTCGICDFEKCYKRRKKA